MLLAKINPPAITVRQSTPFEQPSQILGDYMKVTAERYELGSNRVRFQIAFGYITEPSQEQVIGNALATFNVIHLDSIVLEGQDIQSWGEDDTTIMNIIANKFNTAVETFQNIEVND